MRSKSVVAGHNARPGVGGSNDYPDLQEVNSQACEQKFSWSNNFANVKVNLQSFNNYHFDYWFAL